MQEIEQMKDGRYRIWTGNMYRVLPSIPKSKEEVEENILRALQSDSMKDIFYHFTQINHVYS